VIPLNASHLYGILNSMIKFFVLDDLPR
jgi:hypothetical protein